MAVDADEEKDETPKEDERKQHDEGMAAVADKHKDETPEEHKRKHHDEGMAAVADKEKDETPKEDKHKHKGLAADGADDKHESVGMGPATPLTPTSIVSTPDSKRRRTSPQNWYSHRLAKSAGPILTCEMSTSMTLTPQELIMQNLSGKTRCMGIPDASYKNNPDHSSQKRQVIFLCSEKSAHHTVGSLTDYESHKIQRTVLSTMVAELCAFKMTHGPCHRLSVLERIVDGHHS
eukprot:6457159-Amphidinium_carterae.1